MRSYTFLNERLAKHYGIEGVTGPEFRQVELTTDQRGGILSHASVLTVSSYPTRTSPVIRGKYVLQNILGSSAAASAAGRSAARRSGRRQRTARCASRLEKHRSNAVCASCHSRMDVLGFGLENYDAHRQVAHHGRQVPGRFERHAAQRKVLHDARRNARRC